MIELVALGAFLGGCLGAGLGAVFTIFTDDDGFGVFTAVGFSGGAMIGYAMWMYLS